MKWINEILLSPDDGDGGAGGGAGPDGGAPSGTQEPASQTTDSTSLLGSDGTPPTTEGADKPSQEVTTSPFYMGLYDESGKLNKDKLDALPDHLKDSKDLFGKYDTVESLLGGMRNLAQLAGKKGLEPLPEGSPEELIKERKGLMDRINKVPEDPKQYGIDRPDGYPEDLPWDTERAGKYAEIFHKYSAPPELVKELMAAEAEQAKAEFAGISSREKEMFAAEKGKLEQEYGNEFPEMVDKARRGLASMGLTDGDKPVDANHPIFSNAVAVKMAIKYAEAVSEDKLVSGDMDSTGGMSDREKALDILNNPNNPLHKAYHDPEDPRHEQAVQTRSRFNQKWIERQKK